MELQQLAAKEQRTWTSVGHIQPFIRTSQTHRACWVNTGKITHKSSVLSGAVVFRCLVLVMFACREVDLLVLLCDAVARGLITSAQAHLETQESERRVTQLPDEKPKKGRGKASEKSSSTHGPQFDTAVTHDLKKALEVSLKYFLSS